MALKQGTGKTDGFIMLPTVDYCFKELMEHEKVRRGFLAALLDLEPEKIAGSELMPTVLRKTRGDEKFGVLDVRVKLPDGTQVNLEMQVLEVGHWMNRILFYIGKMYVDQAKPGESYEKLKRCVQVSILNFTLFPKDSRYYRKITFCDADTGRQYTDLLELHILELPKLEQECEEEKPIVRWMRFLGGKGREDFIKLAKEDEYMAEAYDVLDRISADEMKRLEYEAREKSLRDYRQRMKDSWMKGEEEGRTYGEKVGEARGRADGEKIGEARGRADGEKIGEVRGKLLGRREAALRIYDSTQDVRLAAMAGDVPETEIRKWLDERTSAK